MSKIYSAEFRCVDCGAVIDARVADSLNANRLPEAREWVLSRTLFQHPCVCGRTVTAIQPFLYVDFDRGLWVQVVPKDKRPAFQARELEVVAAYRFGWRAAATATAASGARVNSNRGDSMPPVARGMPR